LLKKILSAKYRIAQTDGVNMTQIAFSILNKEIHHLWRMNLQQTI